MEHTSRSHDNWIKTMWRPALAWSYVVINLFYFAIGPIMYNMLEYWNPGQELDAWTSVTLQGGGLYHLSMGAIIGISSHGRTKEKLHAPVLPTAPVSAPIQQPTPVNSPIPTPAYNSTPSQVESGKFGKIIPTTIDPIL